MATTHFYLKRKTPAHKETLIYLYMSYDRKRIKVSTGLSIKPADWSFAKERMKPAVTGSLAFNKHLDSQKAQLERIYHSLAVSGAVPSTHELREALREERNRKTSNLGLLDHLQEYIDEYEGVRSPNTIRNYKNARNHLIQFEKRQPGKLTFEKVTIRLYNALKKYLLQECNMATNTAGSVIKTLKSFMAWAKEAGLHETDDYRKFKVLSEDSDSIFLNEDEIAAIYELDLSARPGYERVRDLFIVGCWTGLRISDLSNLKAENITGNQLKIKTKKTGQLVTVPLHPCVQQIISKYGGSLPRAIAEQKINSRIKEIGREAGITEKRTKGITKGGERINQVYSKCDLISTHTARRSFATNLYMRGIPGAILMLITGHRTEKAFQKYIKADQQMAAQHVAKFFAQTFGPAMKVA